MKNLKLIYVCLLIGINSLLFSSVASAKKSNLPDDVSKFVKERESCDHFRGEEPYDSERAQELNKMMNKYCKGTDKKLKNLRLKYKANPSVLKVLGQFEDQIE